MNIRVHLMWKHESEGNLKQDGDRARRGGRIARRGLHAVGAARSVGLRAAGEGVVGCGGCHVRGFLPAHTPPPLARLHEGCSLTAPPTQGCSGIHCRSSETKSSSSPDPAVAAGITVAIRTVGKATGRRHGGAALFISSVIFHHGHFWKQKHQPPRSSFPQACPRLPPPHPSLLH